MTMHCVVASLVQLESSLHGGVHGVCFVAFGPMLRK